ncbi:MAG TPA: hypothetical protein VL854_03025 [Nitrososphaeraceae archaeon]|nr:hypothetical protein [Nitrososphaeraceae archaeon]
MNTISKEAQDIVDNSPLVVIAKMKLETIHFDENNKEDNNQEGGT